MKSMKEALGYRGLMRLCFSMTGLSGLGGILGMITTPDWATATTLSGITGFWFALGFFFEAELSRERAEAQVECRLIQILDEVKKRECACEAQRRDEADAQESDEKSWLVDLLCPGARR